MRTQPALNWLQALGVELTPYAWATHILICAAIQAFAAGALRVAGVSKPWWFGAVLAIGYAWSREKTEMEFILKDAAHANSVGAFWYRGFIPLEWDWSSQVQFYAPAAAVLVIAWCLERKA